MIRRLVTYSKACVRVYDIGGYDGNTQRLLGRMHKLPPLERGEYGTICADNNTLGRVDSASFSACSTFSLRLFFGADFGNGVFNGVFTCPVDFVNLQQPSMLVLGTAFLGDPSGYSSLKLAFFAHIVLVIYGNNTKDETSSRPR